MNADPHLHFDTELVSLNLSGGPYPMPLASDPANSLGDSIGGYGFVDTQVSITLSSQRPPDATPPGPGPASVGKACASLDQPPGGAQGCGVDPNPIDPDSLDGETFFVDSFFDVFFDITVTDVDPRPGRDFAGQPGGASFLLPNNGPANMQSVYQAVFDTDAPNFGLLPPPQAAPYIGGFQIEIPLGGDINGNGENDKIKFTIVSHAAGDENRTFTQLPDGTIINEFDSAAFLEGAIVDETTDPPFTLGAGSPSAPAFSGPGALTGPTTATSTLLNPVIVDIDVKPGSDPNSINLKSKGVLPVAILTTPTFDATTADPATAVLGDPNLPGTASPIRSATEDVDLDGDIDLVLFFRVQDLVNNDALDEDSTSVVLTAQGPDISASDSVRIVPPKERGKPSPALVGSAQLVDLAIADLDDDTSEADTVEEDLLASLLMAGRFRSKN